VLGILQLMLTHDELKAWGWRIPFVVGACAALVSLYLRRSLHETTTSHERKSKDAGSLASLLKNHRAPSSRCSASPPAAR
jgi:MHS family alpha-ketoglutarate permease-like MFS transporter